jgi:ABC-type antimicrobial peptide transport system permease subunit
MKMIIHKILRHKGRYVSLILSLVIVQCLMIFILNMGTSVVRDLIPDKLFNVDRVYQLEITVRQSDNSSDFFTLGIIPSVFEAIQSVEGIDKLCLGPSPKLTGEISSYQLKYLADTVRNVFYTVAGVGFEKMFDVKLVKGDFFSENRPQLREILITETLAKRLNLLNKPLPQIIMVPGQYNSVEWQANVCGIIKDLNYYNAQKKTEKVYPLISKALALSSCILRVKKGIELTALELKIKNAVQPFVKGDLATVQLVALDETVWRPWNSVKNQVLPIISVIFIILLYTLMALFGLFWTDITRKKAEFGILRAFGFNRWHIFNVILKEVIVISGITIFLTLFISSGISVKMSSSAQYFSFIELWMISSVTITGLILFAAIIPAMKITRLNPVDALSEE